MDESRIARVAVRRVAQAVLDCLPSTSDPNALPFEEAVKIGKKIHPQWILPWLRNKGKQERLVIETCVEMMGRGFMHAAPRALPEWLQEVWGLKEEGGPDLIDKVCDVILNVPDPEKHARYWYLYACGWTCEDVIVEYESGLTVDSGRDANNCSALDELENL